MSKHFIIAGVAMAVAGLSIPKAAEASSYFVRPFIAVGEGGFIDGIQQNGATQASKNFGTDFQTTVDLDDGTVKAQTNILSAQSNGQSGGSFGERLAFSPNAVGTNVDFSFAFDGTIEVSGLAGLGGASPTSIAVFANLYVFEAGSGADYLNFTSTPGALISRPFFSSNFDTSTQTSFTIDEELFGSITVATNTQYDVFASLSVSASTNDNDISILMDFMNTGTFGIEAATGVTYTSSSGIFLDSTGVTPPVSAVPVPAALPLLIGALGCLGFAGRSRRRAAA